ncbi:MAG: hypothetical protein WD423_00715 [Rhodothermales bacterium]
MEEEEEVEELLMDFDDDDSTDWLYTWALTLFRLDGVCDASNDVLDEALTANPEVAALLLNLKKLSPGMPTRMSREAAVEALHYVEANVDPGALRAQLTFEDV